MTIPGMIFELTFSSLAATDILAPTLQTGRGLFSWHGRGKGGLFQDVEAREVTYEDQLRLRPHASYLGTEWSQPRHHRLRMASLKASGALLSGIAFLALCQ